LVSDDALTSGAVEVLLLLAAGPASVQLLLLHWLVEVQATPQMVQVDPGVMTV
jgi:hypothetical protein